MRSRRLVTVKSNVNNYDGIEGSFVSAEEA